MDIAAKLGKAIASAKTYEGSDNIRHGRYLFLIRKVFASQIQNDKGTQDYVFWELTPLESEPNPQSEGDHVDYPLTSGPLKDDGTKPNPVGSKCALKLNFTANMMMAAANTKKPILALFNLHDATEEQINQTWIDLSRKVPLFVGQPDEAIGGKPSPIAKQANPACGMVIRMETRTQKKRTVNAAGAYVTVFEWKCASPIGSGLNTKELIEKRRAEIEATLEDDAEEVAAPQSTQAAAPLPPAPPAPPAAPFSPPAGWKLHPTAPGWYWDGGTGVKSEAQLRELMS
jgi:hypothetical protein